MKSIINQVRLQKVFPSKIVPLVSRIKRLFLYLYSLDPCVSLSSLYSLWSALARYSHDRFPRCVRVKSFNFVSHSDVNNVMFL